MTQANAGDPILYSDWDAIQSVIYEQLGPLQEVAGSPGVFVEGKGYGLAQSQLNSRAYPFTRSIISISSEVQPVVQFDSDHHLVPGEVIFFQNFNNSWGGEPISTNFATVQAVNNSTEVLIDFSTFGFTPWGLGDTAEAVQYYISANQFANLRADLVLAVTHICGGVPGPGRFFPDGTGTEIATPLRGDIIYNSVYLPYYTISTKANQFKYVCNLDTQTSTALPNTYPPSANNTNSWNGLTEYQMRLTWPGTGTNAAFDFMQFFNTGGLVKVDMENIDASNTQSGSGGNNQALNNAWADLMNSVFPVHIGAYGKNAMGLSGDTRTISNFGVFDLGQSMQTILEQFQTGGYSDYSDHYISIQARQSTFQRALEILVQLRDTSASNSFASRVDIDRKLVISFVHSVGAIPLAINPSQVAVTRIAGWT